MVLEDHRVPQVTFQLMIPGAGGYYDPADRVGLASWAAAMMREGTATRTSEQISQALETMAANALRGRRRVVDEREVYGSALTATFPKLFDLSADVLLHPSFPAAEWDRYKTRTQAAVHANPHEPELPRQRDVQPGGVRHASGEPHLRDARRARRDRRRRRSPSSIARTTCPITR